MPATVLVLVETINDYLPILEHQGFHLILAPTPAERAQAIATHGPARGSWLAARRLHQGKFVWAPPGSPNVALEHAQLDALVLGLPWQRMGSSGAITVI